jgi:hypothetical protein
MTQLAIYIDDKLAERLDKAVKASTKLMFAATVLPSFAGGPLPEV